MCIKIFASIFIILSIIYVIQMILMDFGITKKMKPMTASAFVSSAVIILTLYILNSLILATVLPGITRILLICLAIIPFFIGKIAVYKTHRIFTAVQNFSIICGIIYMGYFLYFYGA